MRHALYIVGEPGAGKSTLVGALTDGAPFGMGTKPLAHVIYPEAGVVELGVRRAEFSGTDGLAMSAVVPAEEWVRDDNPFTGPGNLLLAEGDRLACDRFFEALVGAGWDLRIVRLATPPAEAARRREARGSAQKEAWVKGRITKVARLTERWADHVVALTGHGTPEELVHDLAPVSPVAAAFLGGIE
jgi:hypothetical protein